MNPALEIRAISAFRPPRADFASSAPPVIVASRSELPESGISAASSKLDAIDVSGLEIPRKRARPFGLGAGASLALHAAIFVGALLWSQSQPERAPEPIAVEIVVERAPDPPPPAPEPPVAEAAPPVDASPPPPPVVETPPPPAPEPTPLPVATVEPPPPVAQTPPPPAPEPTPSPVATVEPPKPVIKVEPPKPAPPAKKADRAPTPAKPKPKPAASRDANAAVASSSRATASASSASVGEYRDAVYARIRARQHFPESARESGAHGTAEVSFALDEAGQVRSVAIVKSSGEAALDADALATVRRSAPFGPPPPGAPRDYAVKLHYALQ